MGGQFDYVITKIIVEQILGGMWIIPKEDYFGDMVLQLRLYLSRELHIETTSKGPKGGEVLLVGFSLFNWRSNYIRFWKRIGKSDSMVKGIWQKIDIQVISS